MIIFKILMYSAETNYFDNLKNSPYIYCFFVVDGEYADSIREWTRRVCSHVTNAAF